MGIQAPLAGVDCYGPGESGRRWVMRAVVMAFTLVMTVLGTGCHAGTDQSPIVSKESLQADIADRLAKSGQPPKSVTCLQDLVGELGRTARCDVVVGETNSFQP